MTWNTKEIRKKSIFATFQKGFRSWILLVAVCFFFSLLGSSDNVVTSFVHAIDQQLNLIDNENQSNVELLKESIALETTETNHNFIGKVLEETIDGLSSKYTWVINLFAANMMYFRRNSMEVVVYLIFAALISAIFQFFVQNVLTIGRNRYVLEQRMQKETSMKRMFAPFHKRNLLNLIWVMGCYYVILAFWTMTIVGLPTAYYKYRMVPYLLAENPKIKRKDAFHMSKSMTDGYKMQMFLLDLRVFYFWILRFIPVAGLLVAEPYLSVMCGEEYILLRRNLITKNENNYEDILIEKAFDMSPYCEQEQEDAFACEYVLSDIEADTQRDKEYKREYELTDYILLFFTSALVGWVWEVLLHYYNHRTLVNRGTLYGPWLPIYGCGVVICIMLLNRYKKNTFKTFGMAMLLCGILEFFTSWFLEFFYNSHYWNYKDSLLNLNGRICISGLLLFGIGGTFAIYIAGPYLKGLYRKMSKRTRRIVCVCLCTLFVIDFVCCMIFGFNSGAGIGSAY